MAFSLSSPTFTIRQLEETDETVAEVLGVYRGCEDFLALGPVATASEAMVRADFALSCKGGGIFCGIYDPEGVMQGVLDFIPTGFAGDPACAFLELLMIAAPYRGQGLGERVVRAVENVIWQNSSITAIRSGVQFNNPGGIRFWQRMGYNITGPAEDCGDGTRAYPLFKKRPPNENTLF